MGKKFKYLVDTDIIIKIFRGDEAKRKILLPIQESLCISIITSLELLAGIRSIRHQRDVIKLINSFEYIDFTNKTGQIAFSLIKKYNTKNSLHLADALIAAIAIEQNLILITDNKTHFSFIKELKLLNE